MRTAGDAVHHRVFSSLPEVGRLIHFPEVTWLNAKLIDGLKSAKTIEACRFWPDWYALDVTHVYGRVGKMRSIIDRGGIFFAMRTISREKDRSLPSMRKRPKKLILQRYSEPTIRFKKYNREESWGRERRSKRQTLGIDIDRHAPSGVQIILHCYWAWITLMGRLILPSSSARWDDILPVITRRWWMRK